MQIGNGEGLDGRGGTGAEEVKGRRPGYLAALFQAGIAVEQETGGIEDAISGYPEKAIVDTIAVAVAEDGIFGKGMFFSVADELDAGAAEKVIESEFIGLAVKGVADGLLAKLFGAEVDPGRAGARVYGRRGSKYIDYQ